MPALQLVDKVAWVTGASRGLGRAVALGLAGAGAAVLVTARDEVALRAVAEEIEAGGGTAVIHAGSVNADADVRGAAALAERVWGRVDVLVNNAGISPSFRRSEQVALDEWSRVLDVNLGGAFRCCQAALPLMCAGGSIVNVSSVHGAVGHERLAAYTASKGGLELLTRSLALEWAPKGVRVNAVAPGYLETDMTAGLRDHERWGAELLRNIPLGRFGTAADVVPAVLYLASDAANYVTGSTLTVDGGWTAR